MNKKGFWIKACFLVGLIFAVVYGQFWANVNKPLTPLDGCELGTEPCALVVNNQILRVYFEHTPTPEEELLINFDIPKGLKITKAWVEGVNMYMGKTPILFENANRLNQGITFLGSCSLSEMRWQMFIELQSVTDSQSSSYLPAESLSAEKQAQKNADTVTVSALFSTYLAKR